MTGAHRRASTCGKLGWHDREGWVLERRRGWTGRRQEYLHTYYVHAHGVDVQACFGQDAISVVPRCWFPRGPPWGRPCCTALFVRRGDKTTTTTATMMDGVSVGAENGTKSQCRR
ncbi:hypothetical protein VFPBJ_05353 [Purpureocillium lilacinum]|uniref:Uncharacterized protein n=1 Tax=Purpureocillium lilacinum TaxID=33203 RepID=A0A179GQJ4_PURLI|nr:hypothetical protein VFPBJ_05353 [Purpureocillium lilacinum]